MQPGPLAAPGPAPRPDSRPVPRSISRPISRHGWSFVEEARKREIIDALCSGLVGGTALPGPVHAELDLTDRCNVACYFCNQMDVRTKDAMPFEQVERLVDELVAGGLRSVRLSGGGDPLMYPEIVRVFDLLGERGVVVDNLTTNAARLGPEVAERLVRPLPGGAREVMVSLNAVDKLDYHRMMRVAPKIFDTVLENVRHLVALRGEVPTPAVTVQFLIDRESYRRLPEMVALGTSLGVDRIAVNPVLDIPNERLSGAPLLWPGDLELVRPYLRRALEKDLETAGNGSAPGDDGGGGDGGGGGLLHLSFPWEPWNQMVDELRVELQGAALRPYPVAESFRSDLDHCFFGWYSAAIRGTGEIYPCCMLINPTYEPIGDLRQGSLTEQWQGEGFTRLREEMREVFLRDGRIGTDGMKALRPQCVETGRCGLKTMYFRADEAFYRELGEVMDAARRSEIGASGGLRGVGRAAGIFAYRLYWGLKSRWTRLRQVWHRVRARHLPRLVPSARVHLGRRERSRDGVLDGWVRLAFRHGAEPEAEQGAGLGSELGSEQGPESVGPDGAGRNGHTAWADRVIGPGEKVPYRRARAIHAERVLETLPADAARAFLVQAREALAGDGVLRIVTRRPAALDPEALKPASIAPVAPAPAAAAPEPIESPEPAAPAPAVAEGAPADTALWSAEELERELRAAGFVEIVQCSYGRSPHPWLRNLEESPCPVPAGDVDGASGTAAVADTGGDAPPPVLVIEASVPVGSYPFAADPR